MSDPIPTPAVVPTPGPGKVKIPRAPLGFWGVVGAVILALLILGAIAAAAQYAADRK